MSERLKCASRVVTFTARGPRRPDGAPSAVSPPGPPPGRPPPRPRRPSSWTRRRPRPHGPRAPA